MDSARVLPGDNLETFEAYEASGGGRGWRAARELSPDELIAGVTEAGLRGRGGGGFPTGKKWRAVAANDSPTVPATVVVNGAEGEPGTFKDRWIMRRNPYAVIEGALVAARAVGADRIAVAVKHTFATERARLEAAIAECRDAGWCDQVNVDVVTGPEEYLFGEETGLLEVLDGRPPFPRVTPPWREGVDEMSPATGAPPTLVNNVETLANVPAIIAEGPEWFRSVGTEASPGTVVCTITGDTARHGVMELPMGTTLREAIERIGGGTSHNDHHFVAALSGVANPLLPVAHFDTPLCYDAMRDVGAGLGSAGFIVFDETTDLAAIAAGVARFLAVESCGQCTPCKQDGCGIAARLARVCRGEGSAQDIDEIGGLLDTVTIGARCYLATQQQQVVRSVLQLFPAAFTDHVGTDATPVEPALIAPLLDIAGEVAVLDESHARKQPDWTYDDVDSGKAPAERLAS